MLAVLIVGAACLTMMRREVFPEFELEMVLISVPYPGASPEEVEDGICLKIEEAVRPISGIKKQTTVAAEGAGSVVLELESDIDDVQKVLAEIRSAVDRIPTFPELAEDATVTQVTFRQPAIRVAVLGPESKDPNVELKLRSVTEKIRNEILGLPNVSQVNLVGARDYQIDIEIPEDTLRRYGLTLKRVADIVRRENLEMPGGRLETKSLQVLLRGNNKQTLGEDIGRIPLLTQDNGIVLTVADLGDVKDEFTDATAISQVDGRNALVISVDRTSNEDLLLISDEVREFVRTRSMPAGYSLKTWRDESVNVKDRMELLSRNGLQGLLLVFVVLALFLDLRLAFWVALGIPVAILGAGSVLLYGGQTLNMLSMFAFLMALGIVVDDAIVIGENIYTHRELGKSYTEAAVDGTVEVFPSVLASVATTIIAFTPLLFVSGIMGKFIAVMPVAVISMLVISLLESMVILPCHLAHKDSLFFRAVQVVFYPLTPLAILAHQASTRTARWLNRFIERVYLPLLRLSIGNPSVICSMALALMVLAVGLVRSGIAPFVIFPKLDANIVEAKIEYPDGTPSRVTDQATRRIEQAMRDLYPGQEIFKLIHRNVGQVQSQGGAGRNSNVAGSHVGTVAVELVDVAQRTVDSQTIVGAWRQETGEFSGVEKLTFSSPAMGPSGTPIEFKLLTHSNRPGDLEAAVEACKEKLRSYPGIVDVFDDSIPGKWEYHLKIKDRARAMGIPLADLAQTVRGSYFGEEVMRLQRGRHEVKLMVRYPTEERKSLAGFQNIRVRTDDGVQRPLSELADVSVVRNMAEINRIEQMRSITISADISEKPLPSGEKANAFAIVGDLRTNFMPQLLASHPQVKVRWEGQQEQTEESLRSLFIGFGVA
ncbi:MAG: efflux RND transporter permease subunit, partial [Planctomycetaceae bacterium]